MSWQSLEISGKIPHRPTKLQEIIQHTVDDKIIVYMYSVHYKLFNTSYDRYLLIARGREREIENSKKYWHSSLKSTEDDISTTG